MKLLTLTEKQRDVVDYWHEFCKRNNRWPTIAEYCRDRDMPRSTAIGRLNGAVIKKVMSDSPYIITFDGMRELRDEEQMKIEQLKNKS